MDGIHYQFHAMDGIEALRYAYRPIVRAEMPLGSGRKLSS
jgi:hypothetical protein